MIVWLRIDGAPARQFHADARALPWLDPAVARHGLLRDAGVLRAGVGGETPNITVVLRNDSGAATRLLADPPLGAAATLYARRGDATVALFAGVVHDLALDAAECRLGLEA